MSHIRKLLPLLTSNMRKGSCGRLAIIGGSKEYTGAPYFAAISALKLGADLVHVFCAPDAASVIKGYSPDLIVHPGLEVDSIIENLSRCDVIVIGPGLGRTPILLELVKKVLLFAEDKVIPTVVDADGLWFVNKLLHSYSGVPNVVLTPNKVEFSRLCEVSLKRKDVLDIKDDKELSQLAKDCSKSTALSLFLKGKEDIIVSDGKVEFGREVGCLRRCGGQGDVLSGTLAVFFLWAFRNKADWNVAAIEAGLAASQLVRIAARLAFEKEGRSMTTSDLIQQIGTVLREIDHNETQP